MANDRKSILIVEDHADTREMLATQLEHSGYAVETAGDGLEALDVITARVPDLHPRPQHAGHDRNPVDRAARGGRAGARGPSADTDLSLAAEWVRPILTGKGGPLAQVHEERHGRGGGAPPRLCDYIRSRQPDILARWEADARQLPVSTSLSERRLIDHLPEVLRRIADTVDPVAKASPTDRSPEVHALDRLGDGYDLTAVVHEYGLLRDAILATYQAEHGEQHVAIDQVRRLNVAIDEVIGISVKRYQMARERTLVALDRIAEAALQSGVVEHFLPRLLDVLVDTTQAIDVATILLREGEMLRARASVGEEEVDVASGQSIPIGEGFAGTIAARRAPLELRDVAAHPLPLSDTLRGSAVRTLYGVPLMNGDRVIGVAHVGSRSAAELSVEDKLLFRTMAGRASALLVQAELRETAEQAVRRREEMMAVVSHDLRTPLGVIVSGAAMIQARTAEPRTRQHAETIQRAAARMTRLVDDLLDVAKIQSGRLPIDPRDEDVREILQDAMAFLVPLAAEREIHLRTDVPEGPLPVWCDRERIFQVLANLVGNAIKLSRADQTVTVSASVGPRPGCVTIRVHDDGPGIRAEERARIFEPFWSAARHATKGTGLGLFIAKGIIDAHRGTIAADSTSGQGTTFTVVLPERKPSAGARQ